MNRKKLLPILLFLLLLLILLCLWCHTETVVKNQIKSSHTTITAPLKSTNSKTINFNLSKDKNSFELQGNFSNQEELEKILIDLGANQLKNSSNIDETLTQNSKVIALTQSLIPIFSEKYDKGSITYENEKLIVEGSVTNRADKDAISTLLANSTILSVNNTIVVTPQPTAEELAAIETQKEAKEARKNAIIEEKAKKIEAKIQKIIAFEDINFELNKARLTEKSIKTISHIATLLKENPEVRVKIGGHTDDLGDDTHNLNLSQQRVDAVKNSLISMDISEHRIDAIGYGETQPLVSNDTEENRRKNRRVEFKIVGE